MNNVSISQVFSDAWKSLMANLIIILIVAVFSSTFLWISSGNLLSQASYDPTLLSHPELWASEIEANSKWSQMLLNIVNFILIAGILGGLIKYKRSGKEFSFDSFNMSLGTYLKFIFMQIVCGFIIFISMLCCIIPGVYLAVKLLFAPIYVLEYKNISIQDAFKMSWHTTDGHFGTMLGLGVLSVLLIIVGLCCCFIGVWVAGSLVYCMEVCLYVALNPSDKEQSSVEEYNI